MTLDPSPRLLTDRVAIVTGAAVGIGEAIALTYARFGAHVAVCDRDIPNLDATADQIEAEGRRVIAGELDVRDGDAVRAFVEVVAKEFGHVDILVNNAGGGFSAPFLDVNDKGQDTLIRENFTSVTNFTRATVPLMPETGGSIINITSIEAHRAGPNYAVYTAMKAGVASLTKSLALEFGNRLIRVNCIAPDVIPTPGIGGEMACTRRCRSGPRRRHRRRRGVPRQRLESLRNWHNSPRRRRQPRGRWMAPRRRRILGWVGGHLEVRNRARQLQRQVLR